MPDLVGMPGLEPGVIRTRIVYTAIILPHRLKLPKQKIL